MAAGVSDGALIIDTGLDNKGFIRDAGQFKKAVATLTQAVKTSGQQMAGGMNGYLKALQKAGGAAKAATGEQAALQKEIDKTAAAIKRLEERQELARQKFEAAREDAIADATEKAQERNAGAEFLPWEDPEQAMEQLSDAINQAAQEAAEAFGTFEESATFRNSSVEIEFMKEKLAGLQEQMAGLAGDAAPAVQGMAGGFANVAAAAGRALVVIGRFAGHAAIGFLKRLAEGAKNAAIQLAKLAGSAISGGMKKLGGFIGRAARSMLGFHKAQKMADGGLKSSLMSILKYGLGIRGLFALFRKLRTAVKEGFEQMAKSSPEVKSALDSLRGALNGLKGSLATAFAPILTAVAPALTKLINMLTSAINTIGAFMAALTGQKTYKAAVGGLEATGSAASGAASNVKELKRQLAGFDELNILSNSQNGGGGGGAGGGGAGGGVQYETQEIAGGITDFVAKLKELWANADYEGIGREIAGAINNAFVKAKELISWDNLGAKITEAVDAITGIFNGLVDGIDWDLIGRTFGTGINTILNTVNRLYTKIDWKNLGTKIAEGLMGLIDEVDWSLLGETLSNRINGIIDLFGSLIGGIKWSDISFKVATGINSLFLNLNWDYVGSMLTKYLKGVTELFGTLIDEIKWGDIAFKVASGLNDVFINLNFDYVGKKLAEALDSIVTVIEAAIDGIEWSTIAHNFATGINSFIFGIRWDYLASVVAKGINTALASLLDIATTIKWSDIGLQFASGLNRIFIDVSWENLGSMVARSIDGVLSTLRSAVENFSFGDAGKAFAKTVNAFFSDKTIDGFFNVHSIWSDAGKTVSAAIKGLFTWTKDFLDDLDTDQIAADIRELLANVDWDGIATAIWGALVAAVRKLGNLFLAIVFGPDYKDKTKVQQEWEDYVSGIITEPAGGRDFSLNFGLNIHNWDESEAFDALWEAIESALETGEWVAPIGLNVPWESVEAARQEFISEWNALHPEAPIDGKVRLLKEGWTSLSSFVGDRVPVAVSLWKNGWTSIAAYVGTAVTTKISLGKNGWTSIAAYVGTAVTTKVSLGKNGWKTIAGFVGTSVTTKVSLTNAGTNWAKGFLKYLTGNTKGTVTVGVNLAGAALKALGKRAKGGAFFGGAWHDIPQYARGTLNAGSVFAAGEAGPELVGHIGGRTEVLNKSQLASTMFSAVENGMLSALSRLTFRTPAMATGSVLPYSVTQQIAQTGADLQNTLDANNEDLIQTIISVAGQIVAAVRGITPGNAGGGMSTQQIINEINRRTQMFSASPLKGV